MLWLYRRLLRTAPNGFEQITPVKSRSRQMDENAEAAGRAREEYGVLARSPGRKTHDTLIRTGEQMSRPPSFGILKPWS